MVVKERKKMNRLIFLISAMQPPSVESVELCLQSVSLALRHCNLEPVQLLMAQAYAGYVAIVWKGVSRCQSDEMRLFIAGMDHQLATRLLHGTVSPDARRDLACLNAVHLWHQSAGRPPVRQPRRGMRAHCVVCTDDRVHGVSCFSPAVALRQNILLAVCKRCAAQLERLVPFHRQPRGEWCSGCGHRDRALFPCGDGTDWLCVRCRNSIHHAGQ